MSARFLVTADLHLGHRLMGSVRPFGSSEEHDEEIFRRFAETVRIADTVYMLGDVAWNAHGLSQLPRYRALVRKMVLVMGNHDTHKAHRYLDAGFDDVCACVQKDGALLTHIPIHTDQLGRWPVNIHGHTHARRMSDPRYVCVSLEQTDYRPILLDHAIARATS
ncbi:MAG: metallophosphoesterase family protein [Alphaproteobacteria bacterium]|nr:metallophosphoesterase family protein [Alphaproteobacteria bacterium]